MRPFGIHSEQVTHPVRRPAGKYVPDDGAAVAAAGDAEAEAIAVVRQNNHLHLGPFAQELEKKQKRNGTHIIAVIWRWKHINREKTQNAANCRSFPPFLLPQLLMAFLCLLHSFPLPSNPPLLRPWQYFFPFSCSSPKPFSSSPFRPVLVLAARSLSLLLFLPLPAAACVYPRPPLLFPFMFPPPRHQFRQVEEEDEQNRKEAMIYYRFSLFQSRGGGERLHGREGEEERTEARLFSFLPPKEGEEGGGESVIAAVLPPRLAFLASLLPWLLVVGVFGFVGRWCALFLRLLPLSTNDLPTIPEGSKMGFVGPGKFLQELLRGRLRRRSLRRPETEGRRTGIE